MARWKASEAGGGWRNEGFVDEKAEDDDAGTEKEEGVATLVVEGRDGDGMSVEEGVEDEVSVLLGRRESAFSCTSLRTARWRPEGVLSGSDGVEPDEDDAASRSIESLRPVGASPRLLTSTV